MYIPKSFLVDVTSVVMMCGLTVDKAILDAEAVLDTIAQMDHMN